MASRSAIGRLLAPLVARWSYWWLAVHRASFDGRHTLRMLRDSSIRCTTSLCALPMINMGYLDRDWYEGIVQKLKWNVPIRPETDAADIAAFTSRSLLRSKGVQGSVPINPHDSNTAVTDQDLAPKPQHAGSGNNHSSSGPEQPPEEAVPASRLPGRLAEVVPDKLK